MQYTDIFMPFKKLELGSTRKITQFTKWNSDILTSSIIGLTDGIEKPCLRLISQGVILTALFYNLSEARVGMDCGVPWNLHMQIAKGRVYLRYWFSILLLGKNEISRRNRENKLINIKIFNMLTR